MDFFRWGKGAKFKNDETTYKYGEIDEKYSEITYRHDEIDEISCASK